jgi:Leucine-rich repeat (LRR) protein
VHMARLRTLLLSGTARFTELEIHWYGEGPRSTGLQLVLQTLARNSTLTKLGLQLCRLEANGKALRQLALCNITSLQSLDLSNNDLGGAELEKLAPALCRNTSIEVLDMSWNDLNDKRSTRYLRDILRCNKTITTLALNRNRFGETATAVEHMAYGLGSNSTLLKIDLSDCALGDGGVSTLAQTGSFTTLVEVKIGLNSMTSTGVGVLLEALEEASHITDLDLQGNPIGDEGAVRLAIRSLRNNALPTLTSLSLDNCGIGDDGFIALVSALEQNTSLLLLDLRRNHFGVSEPVSERAFLALARSLPEIQVLQRIDLSWGASLLSAMPSLLAGLRRNTSLFRFHVAGCAPTSVPPATEEIMAKFAGGWMQEMERLGYRNRFLPFFRAPTERPLPRGIWPHALARAAALPDVIFDFLRARPNLDFV